jgi:hypothetical protein
MPRGEEAFLRQRAFLPAFSQAMLSDAVRRNSRARTDEERYRAKTEGRAPCQFFLGSFGDTLHSLPSRYTLGGITLSQLLDWDGPKVENAVKPQKATGVHFKIQVPTISVNLNP